VEKPVPSTIPDTPGSYQFKDAQGRILYVGKAKSLRSRVMSYFGTGLGERTRQMVMAADTVEWIGVRNEVEALFLEFNLIQKHRPRQAQGRPLLRPVRARRRDLRDAGPAVAHLCRA